MYTCVIIQCMCICVHVCAEEAIAKGIRRIVALTGPEALKVCLCAFVNISLILLLNYCPRLRVLFCIMYQIVMNDDAIRR